ncbi:MAG: DNA polymerase IV [Deltaproteobacteria bacterium]|nr:DNA polymerase IV [Deltaproteobacteria bacterium]
MAAGSPRTILHVDLDAFYASVEVRDNPSLAGKPVVVGGHARRGVVCAASYEARRFGVRSAMPMVQALKLCPHAVVLAPRMSHYAEISAAFFAILGHHSPLVEGLSLDEAFLDCTGMRSLMGDGATIARLIKAEVRARLGLVASVGVAPNKFLAKIGSDLRKPDGLVVVEPDAIESFLHPLPVSRLWGVGKVTEGALRSFGIATIGDVTQIPVDFLAARLGRGVAVHLATLASGLDERPVVPDREAVSISHEDTFEHDERSLERLSEIVLPQADRVAARLRSHGLRARVVVLKVKYGNHKLVSRRRTLSLATADGDVIGKTAAALLQNVPGISTLGVRLTGVGAAGLQLAKASEPQTVGQLSLLGPTAVERQTQAAIEVRARGERLGHTLDSIRERFGGSAIGRAIDAKT